MTKQPLYKEKCDNCGTYNLNNIVCQCKKGHSRVRAKICKFCSKPAKRLYCPDHSKLNRKYYNLHTKKMTFEEYVRNKRQKNDTNSNDN